MADLILIIPSRGRPQAVGHLAEAFSLTCTANTKLLIAVDSDDPDLVAYEEAVEEAKKTFAQTCLHMMHEPGNMATALNMAMRGCLSVFDARSVGFMGDDHRPRTRGWDSAYVQALKDFPGIVYGNDLIHGAGLPTQFAVSWEVAEAIGFLAPPGLRHMYIDNYWRDLGIAADGLTYLDGVVVEHMHPVAGKAEADEGYDRVNAPEVFDHDAEVYRAYMEQYLDRDISLFRRAVGR